MYLFFENVAFENQVVERKWHVEAHYKFRSSVSTTCIHLTTEDQTTLQKRADLSPRVWYKPIQDLSDADKKIKQWVIERQSAFTKYRLDI